MPRVVARADLKPENVLRHRRGQPSDFANMMARVISDMGRPLNRSELVAALEERDVEIPSGDKERYLGTILWRHRDRFTNFPRVGYWLAGRPWGNYLPPENMPLDPIDAAEHRDTRQELLFGSGEAGNEPELLGGDGWTQGSAVDLK